MFYAISVILIFYNLTNAISKLLEDDAEAPKHVGAVAYPRILFGGVQQIQLRTEDRENGDLGAVAP